MSEELRDEVEAINSIYGEGCLVPADSSAPEASASSTSPSSSASTSSTYILQLPGEESSSLRLQFPTTYPAEPPSVLGTHHSSGGKRGAGARDLKLFGEALGVVFQPGEVCLFDAVEEFTRRSEEEEQVREMVEQDGYGDGDEDDNEGSRGVVDRMVNYRQEEEQEEEVDFAAMAPPPWTLSEVFIENKSTFISHVAPVSSAPQAQLYLQHLLWSDKRIRSATHNITAWRIRGASGASFQDCDDDGETAAGGRLLHLMQVMEVWDVMVVVTRWYGGVKLGPRRFALINAVARDGLVRAGVVVDGKGRKKVS